MQPGVKIAFLYALVLSSLQILSQYSRTEDVFRAAVAQSVRLA